MSKNLFEQSLLDNLKYIDRKSKEQEKRETLLEDDIRNRLKNIERNKLTNEEQKEIKNKLIKEFCSGVKSEEDICKATFRDQKGRFISKKSLEKADIGINFQKNLQDSQSSLKDIYSNNVNLIPELEVDKILKDVNSKLETVIKEACENIKNKFLKEQSDYDLVLNRNENEELTSNFFRVSNNKFLISDFEYSAAKHILFSKFIIKTTELLKNNLEVPTVQISSDSSKECSSEECVDCRTLDLDKKPISLDNATPDEKFNEMFKNTVPKKNNINSDIKKVTKKLILKNNVRHEQCKRQTKEEYYEDIHIKVKPDYIEDNSEVCNMHEESMKEIELATGKSFKKSKKYPKFVDETIKSITKKS